MSRSTGNAVSDIGREILAAGVDDWVMFSDVQSMVLEVTGDASWDNVFGLAVPAIRDLIEEGLVVPGSVTEQDGFVPWDTDVTESVRRILAARDELGDDICPGDVVWLCTTPEGDRRGEELRDHG